MASPTNGSNLGDQKVAAAAAAAVAVSVAGGGLWKEYDRSRALVEQLEYVYPKVESIDMIRSFAFPKLDLLVEVRCGKSSYSSFVEHPTLPTETYYPTWSCATASVSLSDHCLCPCGCLNQQVEPYHPAHPPKYKPKAPTHVAANPLRPLLQALLSCEVVLSRQTSPTTLLHPKDLSLPHFFQKLHKRWATVGKYISVFDLQALLIHLATASSP